MNVVEEKNGKLFLITPTCDKCNKIMAGFFFEFYKQPDFSESEMMKSVFWNRLWFQCPRCNGKYYFNEKEVEKMNLYPLDDIEFPPGFEKHSRIQKLNTK